MKKVIVKLHKPVKASLEETVALYIQDDTCLEDILQDYVEGKDVPALVVKTKLKDPEPFTKRELVALQMQWSLDENVVDVLYPELPNGIVVDETATKYVRVVGESVVKELSTGALLIVRSAHRDGSLLVFDTKKKRLKTTHVSKVEYYTI